MSESTEHAIAAPAELQTGEYRSHRDQTKSFENKRMEQLSQTLRTHARIVRQRHANAYLYHRSELAAWLGQDGRQLLDETLEFMIARGWAGQFGLPDTWWIR